MLTKIKNFFYKILRRSEEYTKTDMVYLNFANQINAISTPTNRTE